MPLSQLIDDLDSVIEEFCSQGATRETMLHLRLAVARRNEVQRQLAAVEQKLGTALSLVEHDMIGEVKVSDETIVPDTTFVLHHYGLTGIEDIDEFHCSLITRGNLLLALAYSENAQPAIILAEFTLLIEDVMRHFEDEERLMDEYEYPNTEAHRKCHAKIIEYLNDAKLLGRNNPLLLTIKLKYFFGRLFDLHNKNDDADLARHFVQVTQIAKEMALRPPSRADGSKVPKAK